MEKSEIVQETKRQYGFELEKEEMCVQDRKNGTVEYDREGQERECKSRRKSKRNKPRSRKRKGGEQERIKEQRKTTRVAF